MHQNQMKIINVDDAKIITKNCDEVIMLRDLTFLFDPEKNHQEPKKLSVSLLMIILNMKLLEIKTKHKQLENTLI